MNKFFILLILYFSGHFNSIGQGTISNLLYSQALEEYIKKEKDAGVKLSNMYLDLNEINFDCADSIEGVKIISINSFDLDSILIDNYIIIYQLWPIEINQKNETVISITKFSCERAGDFKYKSIVINTLEVYFEFVCKRKKYILRNSLYR